MQLKLNSQASNKLSINKTIWHCPTLTRIDIKQTLSTVPNYGFDGLNNFTDP